MTVTDAHAHVQRLASVVKLATVLGKCTSEEQRSAVRFFGQKDSMQSYSSRNVFCLRWEVFLA
jgi:hypothetical protein